MLCYKQVKISSNNFSLITVCLSIITRYNFIHFIRNIQNISYISDIAMKDLTTILHNLYTIFPSQ